MAAPPQMPQQAAAKKKGSGCALAGGIGCLVIILVLVGAGFYVVKNAKKIGLGLAAKGTELTAGAIVKSLNLPPEEAKPVMDAVRELADKIRNGEIDPKQAERIVTAFAEGPLLPILATQVFEVGHLQKAQIEEGEKTRGRITTSRFKYGLANGRIPTDTGRQVLGILMEEKGSGDSNAQFRDKLSVDEIQKCLHIMQDAADQAEIPEQEMQISISQVISDIVDGGVGP